MNIQPLSFIDTSMMTANLLVRYREKMKDGALPLWDEKPLPILVDFKSAKMVLSRIVKSICNDKEQFEIVSARVQTLPPGEATPWIREDEAGADGILRLRCCLVQVPGVFVYSGGETAILPVGQLTLINHRVLHSEANFGLYNSIHLIVDVRKIEEE